MFVFCIIGPLQTCSCRRTLREQYTRKQYKNVLHSSHLRHHHHPSDTLPSSYLVTKHVRNTPCPRYYTTLPTYQCGCSPTKTSRLSTWTSSLRSTLRQTCSNHTATRRSTNLAPMIWHISLTSHRRMRAMYSQHHLNSIGTWTLLGTRLPCSANKTKPRPSQTTPPHSTPK